LLRSLSLPLIFPESGKYPGPHHGRLSLTCLLRSLSLALIFPESGKYPGLNHVRLSYLLVKVSVTSSNISGIWGEYPCPSHVRLSLTCLLRSLSLPPIFLYPHNFPSECSPTPPSLSPYLPLLSVPLPSPSSCSPLPPSLILISLPSPSLYFPYSTLSFC
jgi:hypothetical protein